MPKKKRSPSSKKKFSAKSGKSKKPKKSPSRKGRKKSARKSASMTSGGSSISTVRKKRKKWTDMQIFRVPLDPTQAVLSCCDNASREQVTTPSYQCTVGGPTCGAAIKEQQSS